MNVTRRGPVGAAFLFVPGKVGTPGELPWPGQGAYLLFKLCCFGGAAIVHFTKPGLLTLVMACMLALTLPATARCPERPPCKGCGCKGGPGYRSHATGKCVGF